MPKTCLNCTTGNREEALFCRRCGMPFSAALAVSSAEEPTMPGARSAAGDSMQGPVAAGVFGSETQPPWDQEPTIDLPRSPTVCDLDPAATSASAGLPPSAPASGSATAHDLAAVSRASLPAGSPSTDPTTAVPQPSLGLRLHDAEDRQSRRRVGLAAAATVALAMLLLVRLPWGSIADREAGPAVASTATRPAVLPAPHAPTARVPIASSAAPALLAAAGAGSPLLPAPTTAVADVPTLEPGAGSSVRPAAPGSASARADAAVFADSAGSRAVSRPRATREAKFDRPARTGEPRDAHDRPTSRPATRVAAASQRPEAKLRMPESAPPGIPVGALPVLLSSMQTAVQNVCAGRGTIATAICESRTCGKPEHREEPRCQQINADEERRR